MITVKNVKIDFKKEQLALDNPNPCFYWQIDSDDFDVNQLKYRICVASKREYLENNTPDMFDSGIVASEETLGIKYEGKPFTGKTDYYFSIYSDCGINGSDTYKEGYFRTGLLSKEDLRAKWIENSEIKPVDSPAHAGFLSKTTDNQFEPLWVTLDLGSNMEFDTVVYYGLRIFEVPGLADYPGYQFPRKYRIYCSDSLSGEKTILEDKTTDLVPNPGAQPVFIRFNKITARYITFEATELQAFDEGKYSFGLSQLEVFNGADIISKGKNVIAQEGYQDGEGFGPDKLTDGISIWHKAGNAESLPAPFMKKEFVLDKNYQRAYVYVSALGLYELYINGKRVSDAYLAPEWTDYDFYVQYSCYEVSAFLKKGKNEITAIVGDGWYAGRLGMANVFGPKVLRGKYGKTPKFIAQLDMLENDKIVNSVFTDETWLSAANSPIRANDIYDGEYYDARYEDELSYKNVSVVPGETTSGIKLVSFINEQIKSIEDITPESITEPVKGIYVVDFGKNVSGFCSVKMHGQNGQKILLRHAGGLRKNGTGYFANLRGAFAIDTYIFKDSKEITFTPHFTYHGFRYLEITGLSYMPEKEDIICRNISSGFEETGKISFENPFYNWLLAACKQTIRSNHVGVVTDCNDRDERLPWLMEGLESQSYLYDGALFWERHLMEHRENHAHKGNIASQCPDALNIICGDGSVPRTLIFQMELEYALYGNKHFLEQNYDLLCEMAEKNRVLYPDYYGGNPDYIDCDWLNTTKIMAETGISKDIPQISEEVFCCVTNARFYRMMAFASKILGKKDKYQYFTDCFNDALVKIDKKLTNSEGFLNNNSQAAYGMMLFFKIVLPEKEQLFAEKLKEIIGKCDNRFNIGVYTVGNLVRTLSDHGMHDLAYKLMTDDRCPSLKYMMDEGSKTVWERWDTRMKELPDLYEKPRWQVQNKAHTILTENGYEDISMNSFNHIEYTCITPWLTENILGLRTDENCGGGFKRFVFKTNCNEENKWAKGTFNTIRGQIQICWKKDSANKKFECKINIPANTSCEFNIPDEFENVSVNGKQQEEMTFELKSGKYYICATKLM